MPVVSTFANLSVLPLGFGSFSRQYWNGVLTDTNYRITDPCSVIPMPNGNIAFSMSKDNSYLGAYWAAALLVLGNDGSVKWSATANPAAAQNIYGSDADVDSSNNLYLIGTNSADDDVYLNKFDSSGTFQYSRRFSATNTLGGGGCAVTSDDTYVYLSVGEGTTTPDIGIIKFDVSNLTISWDQKISSSNTYQETRHRLALDSSSNVYALIIDLTEDNVCVSKWGSGGTGSWHKAFVTATSTTGVVLHNIAIGSSDDVYFSLSDRSTPAVHVIKTNSSGTVQWSRKLTSATLNMPTGLGSTAIDSSDNVYVYSPYEIITGVGNLSYAVLAKYNSSGTLQWQRYFQYLNTSGTQMTVNDCMIGVTDNDIYLNASISSGTGTNMHILRLPTDGSLTGTYTLPANIGTTAGTFTYAAGSFTDSSHTLTTGTNPTGTTASYTLNATSVSYGSNITPTVTTGVL